MDYNNPYESLHAYWRMPYIKAHKNWKKDNNPFKDLKESTENQHYFLLKGSYCCIILNRFPYNAGHLLVLPYREISDISELDKEEKDELMEQIIEGKSILSKALRPDAFNIGFNLGESAGAGIPIHLHCHIVPRWNGDHNFMPVISNTRVLPESLEDTWAVLKKYC